MIHALAGGVARSAAIIPFAQIRVVHTTSLAWRIAPRTFRDEVAICLTRSCSRFPRVRVPLRFRASIVVFALSPHPMRKFEKGAGFYDGLARRALRRFIVEILRALARGHDVRGRSAQELAKLVEHLSSSDTSLNVIVDDVVAELHAAEYQDLARQWREQAAKFEAFGTDLDC